MNSNTHKAHKLNTLGILNSKLLHNQQSSKAAGIMNMPHVYHGHMTDGIHDLVYGYANTNRVYHELISNAKRAIAESARTTSLGVLSDYITAGDEIDTVKLHLDQSGKITDNNVLTISNLSKCIIAETLIDSDIIAAYIADELNVVFLTETLICSYNFNTHKTRLLVSITENDANRRIVSSQYLDTDTFQIVTNKDICHYKILTFTDDAGDIVADVTADQQFQISITEAYNMHKLSIVDVSRPYSIEDILLTDGADDIRWFNNFVPFVHTAIADSVQSDTVNMLCLGVLTGKFGAYMLIRHNSGQLFVRIVDNTPVIKTLIYAKNNKRYLITFNDIGVRTYLIDDSGISAFTVPSDDININAVNNLNWLDESGNININNTNVNVNSILEYGYIPDSTVTQNFRIPGASIADIKYGTYTDYMDNVQHVLYDIHTQRIICLFDPGDRGMLRLVNEYNLHEFNCFKEVAVTDAVAYDTSDKHYLFAIHDVGIVGGHIMTDANGVEGMQLPNVQSYANVSNNRVKLLHAQDCIFVYNADLQKLYTSSMLHTEELTELPITNRIAFAGITRHINRYVYVIDANENTLYRGRLRRLVNMSTPDITAMIIDSIVNNKAGVLHDMFKEHLMMMHAPDSAMTRLNQFIYDIQQANIHDSTIYVPDSDIAYVSTGYGLNNVERKVTDSTSPNVYGRIKSQTTNAYIGMKTAAKRATDSILYYDTVIDSANNIETSLNSLAYTAYKLSDNMLKLVIDVPTTCTHYVNNILGWSKGANTGTAISRTNLNGGYLAGRLENVMTEYQLVLNRNYFNIKRIINANCQLASAPLNIFSDKEHFDATHYGMFDSPVLTPICLTPLLADNTYKAADNQNNEITLTYGIFGGDALTISLLIETM